MDDHQPTEMPIDGTLDLHTFDPGEVRDLIGVYLAECRNRGIYQVRIIHGKGTGTLRTIVHSRLSKIPFVDSYHLAGEGGGGWGATIAILKPLPGN